MSLNVAFLFRFYRSLCWGHHSNYLLSYLYLPFYLATPLRLSNSFELLIRNLPPKIVLLFDFRYASREKLSNWTSACTLLFWTRVSNRLLDCLSRSIQIILGSPYLTTELDESTAFRTPPCHSNHIHTLDDCRRRRRWWLHI
jgi:hypothetical protein